MKQFTLSLGRLAAKALLYWMAGGITILAVAFVLYLDSRPELKIWHEAELDAEFTVKSSVSTFSEYIAREETLFSQLGSQVLDHVEAEDRNLINRFHRGSLSDPGRWPQNWNRTFEFAADEPKAGVLLLHGMSDSPYSLHHIGQQLHTAGAWVVGLRLPGHGTTPSGLTSATWQDMAAAVRLASNHIHEKTSGCPLYLVGYSNGGALAVHYALSAIEQDHVLPRASGLVLISPSIGVSGVAFLAKWQARFGKIPGLHKLLWNSVRPEYDPFKYGSFAVNAGAQVYSLTIDIQEKVKRLGATGELDGFPSVLAFQSAVDATVSTRALVQNLFEKLPAAGNELVLFDINRYTEIEQILRTDPKAAHEALLSRDGLSFSVSLLTNRSEKSPDVIIRHRSEQSPEVSEINPGLCWPKGIYSLSHVALPFPEKDSLYGHGTEKMSPGIQLGKIELKGERNVLQISAADMIRLRWNPFYPYLEQRLLEFVGLEIP